MFEPVYRQLLNLTSLHRRRLSIVVFHRALPAPDPLRPGDLEAPEFARRIDWLRENFRLMTLRDAVRALAADALPARALCVTFDDGYADNVEVALPLLRERDVPATFFVTTRYLDGGMMWNDRVIEAVKSWPDGSIDLSKEGLGHHDLGRDRPRVLHALIERLKYLDYDRRDALASRLLADSGSSVTRLMMTANQIRTLHREGMEIGGHTDSHPIMTRLDDDAVRAEIITNRQKLEAIIDAPVTSFAYPNGRANRDYHAGHPALLEDLGFECAVTTMPGCASDLEHRYEIPRFTPWDRTRTRYLLRLARNQFTPTTYAAIPA